jgi:mannose-6-phosphate isomerase-like protein (cupin superfamily)
MFSFYTQHPYYMGNTSPYSAQMHQPYPSPHLTQTSTYHSPYLNQYMNLKDYGPQPYVVNIDQATKQNNTYRTALWTGKHLQVTLMSINVGDDIGLEIHPNVDQFIRIEEGAGIVMMGDRKDQLTYQQRLYDDYAIMIPAGKWHNVINTGYTPLKLYAIYAPPEHPRGTIHQTKEIAQLTEKNYGQ